MDVLEFSPGFVVTIESTPIGTLLVSGKWVENGILYHATVPPEYPGMPPRREVLVSNQEEFLAAIQNFGASLHREFARIKENQCSNPK